MSTQLPFEILTLIIDFVAAGAFICNNEKHDTTSLRNCALVSPVLTVHCQKHLFSHIEIAFDKPHTLSNLQQVLDIDHPEIGSYIKFLSVIFRLPRCVSYQGLDRILKSCTQVAELTIRSLPFGHGPSVIRRYSDLPKKVRLELEPILYSPTCKAVTFEGLTLPISMFATPHRSHTLESLTLVQDGICQEDNGVLPEGPSYSSLRFLSLPTSRIPELLAPKFRDGQYLFDFTDLATLWVNNKYSRAEPNVIAQMLHRAPRLQTLGLTLGSYPPSLLRNILSNPAQCFSTTLVEIRLNLFSEWRSLPNPDKDPFAGELAGFRALSESNVLKIVYIELEMERRWGGEEIVPERWLRAATTFADPGSFPTLKKLTVDVITRKMLLSFDERGRYKLVSGERLVNDLLKVPFDTLELPYRFNFSVRAVWTSNTSSTL